jgi:hypothetical protein
MVMVRTPRPRLSWREEWLQFLPLAIGQVISRHA